MATDVCCLDDLEDLARSKLSTAIAEYYLSGACGQNTVQENIKAFQRLRIRPRILRDVSHRGMSVVVQGERLKIPIGVAPTAMQKMAHPEGECANAKACGKVGTVFILSSLSTCSIEEVASAAPDTTKWFQLYIFKNRKQTEELVLRAEAARFSALVLTVDTVIVGRRYADARNNFVLPSHLKFANFDGALSSQANNQISGSAINTYGNENLDQNLTWEDVSWLKSISKMPVIVKGVLCPEDARIAVDVGVAGIIVSNHGGRQLDTTFATIEVLSEIVKAVDGRVEVYLDGGIRNGTDVFKALALGAKMVFIGRPAVWGLAYNGEEGVKKALDILSNELDITLALAGCCSVADIKEDMVAYESTYSKL